MSEKKAKQIRRLVNLAYNEQDYPDETLTHFVGVDPKTGQDVHRKQYISGKQQCKKFIKKGLFDG